MKLLIQRLLKQFPHSGIKTISHGRKMDIDNDGTALPSEKGPLGGKMPCMNCLEKYCICLTKSHKKLKNNCGYG